MIHKKYKLKKEITIQLLYVGTKHMVKKITTTHEVPYLHSTKQVGIRTITYRHNKK